MFKQIKRCVNSADKHAWISVSLPAVESINSKDEFTVVADPSLSVDDIMQVLKDNWTEEYIKKMMLTRFIAVIADNSVRTNLKTFCEENPNASQDDIDSAMQNYVDSGWNVNLKHPSTDRQAMSAKKKTEKASQWVSEMDDHAKLNFMVKLAQGLPEELSEKIISTLDNSGSIYANNAAEVLKAQAKAKKTK